MLWLLWHFHQHLDCIQYICICLYMQSSLLWLKYILKISMRYDKQIHIYISIIVPRDGMTLSPCKLNFISRNMIRTFVFNTITQHCVCTCSIVDIVPPGRKTLLLIHRQWYNQQWDRQPLHCSCLPRIFRFNTSMPRQNGRHLPDDIFKWIFVNENAWISIKISLKFVPKGQINNIPALV